MRIHTHRLRDLREVPTRPEEARLACALTAREVDAARTRLATAPSPEAALILARELKAAARALRLAADLDAARLALAEAIDLFEAHGKERAAFLCHLARAGVEGEAGELDLSLDQHDVLLQRSLERAEFEGYRPFVLQSRAALHALGGQPDLAVADLAAAIELWNQPRAERLIVETRAMIHLLSDATVAEPVSTSEGSHGSTD